MKRLLLVVAIHLGTGSAWAEERSCAAAFERAQELRAKGHLLEARAELLSCEAVCAEELRRYCVSWRVEVEQELGTVLVVARRGGVDIAIEEVSIRVDGVEHRPERGVLVLQPGLRQISLTNAGQTITQSVRVEAGTSPANVVGNFPTLPPASEVETGSPVMTWVLVGVGGAALIAAGALAINGHRLRAKLEDSCAPTCLPSSIEPIQKQWVASGILAGIGSAALIGATLTASVGGAGGVAFLELHGRF